MTQHCSEDIILEQARLITTLRTAVNQVPRRHVWNAMAYRWDDKSIRSKQWSSRKI